MADNERAGKATRRKPTQWARDRWTQAKPALGRPVTARERRDEQDELDAVDADHIRRKTFRSGIRTADRQRARDDLIGYRIRYRLLGVVVVVVVAAALVDPFTTNRAADAIAGAGIAAVAPVALLLGFRR